MMQTVDQILRKHGVWTLQEFEDKADDRPLFEDLYAFYSSTGDMPYGTMKARTGDPSEWIFQRVQEHMTQ